MKKFISSFIFSAFFLLLGLNVHAGAKRGVFHCREAFGAKVVFAHDPVKDFSRRLEAQSLSTSNGSMRVFFKTLTAREVLPAAYEAWTNQQDLFTYQGEKLGWVDGVYSVSLVWYSHGTKVILAQIPHKTTGSLDNFRDLIGDQFVFIGGPSSRSAFISGRLQYRRDDNSVELLSIYAEEKYEGRGLGLHVLKVLRESLPVGTVLTFESANDITNDILRPLYKSLVDSPEAQAQFAAGGSQQKNAYLRAELLRRTRERYAAGENIIWMKVLDRSGWEIVEISIDAYFPVFRAKKIAP